MADPAAPTGFLLHPASPLHDTGWGHPEHQGRLRALASTVGRDLLALHGHVEQVHPRDATADELRLVHTPEHVESVRHAAERAEATGSLQRLDADTIVSAASWDAAVGSVGAVLEAAERVADGRLRNAFVAARPPGHHATPERAMGFCLFNNVAVGARWVQRSGRAERVLIVDVDVHHGNGTQDAFYRDGTVFYLSLHQWPHYPGTGAADETGEGPGRGWTLNVPLPAATPAAVYLERFEAAFETAWERARPDFVFLSAGFDVLAGDPLGGQLLEPGDLYRVTRYVVEAAAQAGAGLVAVLEGGYAPKRTGLGAVAVIRALAGIEAP
ncbi:MAG: histone deacetylase [Gemmatimonadetes bacterium]|nr:MAG: histone deacetylase [Gemmatimonadota bacterium]